MGRNEFALLLLLSFVWGCIFFFLKILVHEYPPLTIVVVRLGLAALALHALLIVTSRPLRASASQWRDFLVLGALNNAIPFSLITWGETRITSGLTAILNATTPLFTVLVSHYVARSERLSWNRALGVIIGFAGVAILLGPQLLAHVGGRQLPAEAACLLAALLYAFAANFARRFRAMSPLSLATGQITASTLILIPVALLLDRPWMLASPTPLAVGAFLAVSVFSTSFGYVLFFRVLAVAGATNILLVTLLMPVTALLLGAALIDEQVTWQSLAGMLVIATGLTVLDGQLLRALHRFARRHLAGRNAQDRQERSG